MKKAILFVVFAICMMNISCGSNGSSGSSSGSTAVTIRFGQSGASAKSIAGAVNSSTLPSGVTTIRVTVSASDMATIVKEVSVAEQSSVTITIDIPNGPNRRILVEALDASGKVLYRGESVVNLGGKPLQLTISMVSTSTCDLYVDTAGADESDCTDINAPCRTITYTLTQTAGSEVICIAAGTYEAGEDQLETFPLVLKSGTTIKCRGANHSTIISETSSTAIIGAAGAVIEGCMITGDPAIDDNGQAVTVNDCIISGSGDNTADVGIILSSDSRVTNSTIRNHMNDGVGVGVRILSGSPVLSGNIISDNENGVRVLAGTPIISGGNTLSCNTSIDLENVTSGVIDARNNIWDHTTPTEAGYPDGCPSGVDVCNSNVDTGSVIVTGSTQAAVPCIE